ncbi:MAG TPA: hypothetical protein VKM55_24815 [Candidatus Lokiarchaeia archaeon]|nr:hypothetical protein [Candidatus Lokiarchaeia archaeon]
MLDTAPASAPQAKKPRSEREEREEVNHILFTLGIRRLFEIYLHGFLNLLDKIDEITLEFGQLKAIHAFVN